MKDKISVGVEIILLNDRSNHYRRALMRTEEQTMACQFPNVSLPEYTLFALLLFFVPKIVVIYFVCYMLLFGICNQKDKSRMSLMVAIDLT